ncbi:hypothetical protein NW754_010109 [Fusarium falciforme]|nr:hypothetical protein NW754_010109 [Fusarium falciforme]
MATYQYQRLQPDEIRLLALSAGSYDAKLEGSLDIFRLPENEEPEEGHQVLVTRDTGSDVQNAPPYEALSYTWGSLPISPHTLSIVVGEGETATLDITPNLDLALRRLRQDIPGNKSRLLWIDAVCINQSDLVEKSTQIPKMAMIYNRAEGVSVWLGGDDAGAVDFIDKLLNLDGFDPLTKDPGTPEEWAALLALMQRPWFNRRWIVQEISLARRATLLCETRSVSWEDFSAAVALFTSRYQDLRALFQRSEKFQNHPNYLGEVDALGAKCLVDLTSNLFRKSEDGAVLERLLSLEGLISTMAAFEAASPHDTIYAVLWLAHDAQPDAQHGGAMSDDHLLQTPQHSPTLAGISSDEDMSDYDLGTHMPQPSNQIKFRTPFPKRATGTSSTDGLEKLSRRSTSLKPPVAAWQSSFSCRSVSDRNLRNAEKHFEGYPTSIIVDYNRSVYEVCKEFLEFAIGRSRTLDIICCPWAPEPPPDEPKLPSWITQLDSTPFDKQPGHNVYRRVLADPLVGCPGHGPRIYNASGKTKIYPSKGFIQDRVLVAAGFVLDAVGTTRSPAYEGIIPSTWLDLIDWSGPPNPVPDRLWRTLVADRGQGGKSYPPAYFPLACKWMFEQRSRRGGINTAELLTSGRCPSIASEFLRRVQGVIWGRQMMLTEGRRGSSKFLGLVPAEAREGDLICILYGCSVPLVLRRLRSPSKHGSMSSSFDQKPEIIETQPDGTESIRLSTVSQSTSSLPSPNETPVQSEPCTISATLDSGMDNATPAEKGLAVPAQSPSVKFASVGVRKALRKDTTDSKPPDLATSLESQYQCELIGECYIHGMMDGEAFKHQREYGNKLRLFHLL